MAFTQPAEIRGSIEGQRRPVSELRAVALHAPTTPILLCYDETGRKSSEIAEEKTARILHRHSALGQSNTKIKNMTRVPPGSPASAAVAVGGVVAQTPWPRISRMNRNHSLPCRPEPRRVHRAVAGDGDRGRRVLCFVFGRVLLVLLWLSNAASSLIRYTDPSLSPDFPMKLVFCFTLAAVCANLSFGQVLTPRSEIQTQPAPVPTTLTATPVTVPLVVPADTPLKIELDQEIRIRRVGQPVRGRVVQPVYVFDKVTVPAGTVATGTISEMAGVSKRERALAALNADFSPARQVRITFNELQLADGRRIPIHTEVLPQGNGVLQLVSADAKKPTRTDAARNAASRRISAARQQIRDEWNLAKAQFHMPGKMHRLERLGIAELPYRPQYIDAGATFSADLKQPLDFGEEKLAAESLSRIGTPPAVGSVLHAELVTPLSSATSKKGDPVAAVITEPLFASDRLVLPEGSRLEGTVLQVRPARRLARNGLLRIEFQKLVPPDGVEQKIAASLEAIEVAQKEHLALDSEGGAQATNSGSRYFTTALSVALAASSMSDDHDHDGGLHNGDRGGNGAVTGASGFRLVGMFAGALGHSRALSSGLGFYGAGMSVYCHFLARGREVVYPKNMSMLISLDTSDCKHAPVTKTERPAL